MAPIYFAKITSSQGNAFYYKSVVFGLIFVYLFTLFFYPFIAYAQPLKTVNTIAYKTQQPLFHTKLQNIKAGTTLADLQKQYNLTFNGLRRLNPSLSLFKENARLPAMQLILPESKLTDETAANFNEKATGFFTQLSSKTKTSSSRFSSILSSHAQLLNDTQGDVSSFLTSTGQFWGAKASSAVSDQASFWLQQFGTANIQLGLNDKWRWSGDFDLLLPLYDKDKFLFFTQGSYRYKDSQNTLNLGIGHRYFFDSFMLGVNGFYDYDPLYGYKRLGLGAELWRNYLKFTANGYFGLGSYVGVLESDEIAKPAHGFDVQLDAYLPIHPQLGFSAGYEQYFGDSVAIDQGGMRLNAPKLYQIGLSYTPVPLISFDLMHKRDFNAFSQTRVGMNLTYRLGVPFDKQFSFSEVDATRKLGGARYDLVKRNKEIILNYKKEDVKVKEEILGQSSDVLPVFDNVVLADDWQIAWDNLGDFESHTGQLFSDCYQVKTLKSCKIRLPISKGNLDKDPYMLKLLLTNAKTQKQQSFEITVKVLKDEVILVSGKEASGEQRATFPMVVSVSLGSGVSFDRWEIPDLFTEKEGVLSPECFDVASLERCQITLPFHDGSSIPNDYPFVLYLKKGLDVKKKILGKDTASNATEKALGDLKAQTVIRVNKPKDESLDLETPVKGYAGQIISLVKNVQLNDGWVIKDWLGLSDLEGSKGKLADDCFDVKTLAKCEVTLPDKKEDSSSDDSYKLTLQLHNSILEKDMSREIDILVQKARSDFIEANQAIIGYKGDTFNLFDDIYLTPDRWRVLDISVHSDFNTLGGAFSPECKDVKKLKSCRITLPAFDNNSTHDKNEYIIDFKLYNQEEDFLRQEKIKFTVYPEAKIDVVNPIMGKQNSKHKPFKIVSLDQYWENQGWSLPKDFVDLGGAINADCATILSLKACEITLPTHSDAQGRDRYDLVLTLNNSKKGEKKLVDITVFVNEPPAFVLEMNTPLEGFSGKFYPAFKKAIVSSENWKVEGWDFDPEFTDKGGTFSSECQEVTHLASCQITLPKLDASGTAKTYDLNFKLYNVEYGYERKDALKIVVSPPEGSKDYSTLTLEKDELPFLTTSKVDLIAKDADGQLIDVDPEELGEFLELRIEPIKTRAKIIRSNKTDDETQSTKISSLIKKGHGHYSATITAGSERGLYDVVAYYYNKAFIQKSFLVYNYQIDETQSQFYADSLKVPQGGRVMLHFVAKNATGDLIKNSADRIRFLVENSDGKAYQLSDITEMPDNLGHYQAELSSDEETNFTITPMIRVVPNAEETRFNSKALNIEFKGQLFDGLHSTLKADNDKLATIDPNGLLDRTLVRFTARDKDNKPLIGYEGKLQFIVRDAKDNEVERLKVLNTTSDGQYVTNFVTNDGINYKDPGDYYIYVTFLGNEITAISAKINIDSSLAEPDFDKTVFVLDRSKILLDSLNGLPIEAKLSLYDTLGNPHIIIPKKINFVFKNEAGQIVNDVANVEDKPSLDLTKTYLIKALKTGKYQVIVQYMQTDGTFVDLREQSIIFIDDQPSSYSRFYPTDSLIAVNDSAGYKTKTDLIFEAYDPYNEVLDLSLYTNDKDASLDDLKVKVEKGNIQLVKDYDLKHVEKNRYQVTLQSDLIDEMKKVGQYSLILNYKNQLISGIATRITLSPNHAFPEQTTVTPTDAFIDLSKENKETHLLFTYRTKEGYLQDDMLPYLHYVVTKDGVELTHEETQAILSQTVTESFNYDVLFKPKAEGDYVIQPYSALFDETGAIVGSKAVNVEAKIRVRAGGDSYYISKNSTIKVDNPHLASYDDQNVLDRTKFHLTALNKDNELTTDFADHLALVVMNSDYVQVQTLPVTETKPGIYSTNFATHDQKGVFIPVGIYTVFVAVNGNVMEGIKTNLTIDQNLSPIDTQYSVLETSSKIGLLKDLDGKAIDLTARLYDHFGQKQNPALKTIQIVVKDQDNVIIDDAAEIADQTEKGSYKASALKTGQYQFILQEKRSGADEVYQDCLAQDVLFIDSQPDDSSTLSFADKQIAVNNSAGYKTETELTFAAAIKGNPLDLSLYSENKTLVIEDLVVKVSYQDVELNKTYTLTHKSGPYYSAIIDLEPLKERKQAGSYKFDVFYKNANVGAEAKELLYSANLAFPEKSALNSLSDNLIDLTQTATIEFTYATIEDYVQDDIDKRLIYHVYKDGKLLDNGEKLYITREGIKDNIYKLSFKLGDKADESNVGLYKIVPAYQKFTNGLDGDYEEVNAKAEIKIVADMNDYVFDKDKSSFTSQDSVIATIDKNTKTDRTKLILKARTMDDQPSLNLLDLGLTFVVKDVNDQIIEVLAPTHDQPGEYSAVFSSVLKEAYKAPGLYKIEAQLKNKSYLTTNILIDPDLAQTDAHKSLLTVNRLIAGLESLKGYPLTIEIEPKDALGNAQTIAKQNLSLKIMDGSGVESDNSGRFEVINTGTYKKNYNLYAQKIGTYQLELLTKDKVTAEDVTLNVKPLLFTDGIPSSQSTISFDDDLIALDDSAGYKHKTKLHFTPKFEDGTDIDYLTLFENDRAFAVTYVFGDVEYKDQVIDLTKINQSLSYQVDIDGEAIISPLIDGKRYAGEFTFYPIDKGNQNTVLKTIAGKLVVSPNHAMPSLLTKSMTKPEDGIFSPGLEGQVGFILATKNYEIPQDNIPWNRLDFEIIKDGFKVPDAEAQLLLGKEEREDNIYWVGFTPQKAGKYEVRIFYTSYKGNRANVSRAAIVTVQ